MEKKLEPNVTQKTELSYEELKNVAQQLSNQAQQLQQQNQKLVQIINENNLNSLYKRLDYLFEIINGDNKFLPEDFKKKCAEEIEKLMAAPEQEEESKE